MENNQDRRVRKTRKALKDGLIHFMQEKSVNNISVKELCDYCDLNRGTFYIHYKDIFDMLEKIEGELMIDFQETISCYDSAELEKEPTKLLQGIFDWIYANRDMAKVLLSENGDMTFISRLKRELKVVCVKHWEILFNPNKSQFYDMYFNYLISGCIGVITSWLNDDIRKTPKEMATIVKDMILKGVGILQ